jgi:hypothetical protein
VIKEAN